MSKTIMYFESLLRKSGQAASILFGVTLLVTSIMLYIFGGLAAKEDPVMGILAIPATASLILAIFVIIAGTNLGRGTLKNNHVFRVVISYLAMIIALCIIGLIFESLSEFEIVPLWASITGLIGCIFLIIATQMYRISGMRTVAGGISIAGVIILIVGILELLSPRLPGVGIDFGIAGVMGMVNLTVAMWILMVISALLYSLLNYIKHKPIPYLVLMIGFLLFGVGLAINGFSNVSDHISVAKETNWAIPLAIATVLTGITGISILIASSLGITTMGLSLVEIFVPGKKPLKCPNCGTTVKSGEVFCKSCGAKLPEEQPVPPSEEVKKFCPNCGTSVELGMKFCSKCGTKLK